MTNRARPTDRPDCVVSTQALCYGPLETSVFAVARSAARPGERTHIGLRFGRVLIYLEDRAALDALTAAVRQARVLGDNVFAPARDSFTEVEERSRQRFETTGDVRYLR